MPNGTTATADAPQRSLDTARINGQTHRVTAHARKAFLDALRQTGNVAEACRRSGNPGFSRKHAYRMRDADPEFAAAWAEAEQIATDALELEARRRAVEGVTEPFVSLGRIVRTDDGAMLMRTTYSDRLLETLLRGHRPEKYRDNTVKLDVTFDIGSRLDTALRYRDGTIGQVIEGESAAPAIEHKPGEGES